MSNNAPTQHAIGMKYVGSIRIAHQAIYDDEWRPTPHRALEAMSAGPFLKKMEVCNHENHFFSNMQLLIDHNDIKERLHSSCLVFVVLLLTASPALPGEAELTNLIVRNNNDELQVDLLIKGIFTQEMKAAVSKGIPIRITFLILLYEVHDYWFNDKMVNKTAMHDISFDVLRKEYRIRRSWEKRIPLVAKNFEKAQSLFSEIQGFNVIPLNRLKKGKHYQLRIKSELSKKKAHLTGLPWEFDTDWYTINFIY